MATTILTNTYYKDDMIFKETIVDGEVYEIVEQYLDEEGNLIYEYKHDYTPGELLKMHRELEQQKHDLDYYGAKGVIRILDANERREQEEKRRKEKEAKERKEKNKAQYNKKLNKKLEKNRKRG